MQSNFKLSSETNNESKAHAADKKDIVQVLT